MIIDFTSDELKALKALEDSYEKLIKAQEKKILELRPDDPQPDDEAYRKIQESRIPEPVELRPEPVEYTDGDIPVYSKEALDAYYATPEYQAYRADNRRANEAVNKLYEDWYAAGSKKWKEARKKLDKLEKELSEARDAFFKKVEDRQFSALGEDLDAILEDARSQVDRLIVNNYKYFEKMGKDGSFSSRMVRAQDDGSFLLDTTEEREAIRRALSRHIEALEQDPKLVDILYRYIEDALEKSELVGDTGKLGGLVRHEVGLMAQPLDKATVLITRLMNVAFNGKKTLERDYNKDFGDPTNRYDLGLYSKDCPYNLKVAIDYNAMIDNELVKLPALTRLAKHIYDAIVSYWLQGNYTPTYRQIWRATCGNIKREIKYGTKEKLAIEKALLSFKASIAFSTGEIVELNDKNVVRIKEAGGAYQLLHYDTKYVKVNGQRTDVLLLDPNKRPVLLEIAQALNNEYMTDNINFFDVRGLVATEENLDLKEYLFIRIKKMKNPNNHVKQKKIALDTLVEDLGIKPFDKSNPKDRVRKSRLVERITKILDNAVDVNFIEGYTANKRKGSTEVISFTIELYKKKGSVSSVS